LKRFFALLPLTLIMVGCSAVGSGAPAPEPAPSPFDPVGVYDCTFSGEGQQMPATLTISGSPGAYTGTISGQMGSTPLSGITVDGDKMTFSLAPAPEMVIRMALVFSGDTFTGTVDGGQFTANMSGKKR
jgi:hypothetical protein